MTCAVKNCLTSIPLPHAFALLFHFYHHWLLEFLLAILNISMNVAVPLSDEVYLNSIAYILKKHMY